MININQITQNQIHSFIQVKEIGSDKDIPLSIVNITESSIFLQINEPDFAKMKESNRQFTILFQNPNSLDVNQTESNQTNYASPIKAIIITQSYFQDPLKDQIQQVTYFYSVIMVVFVVLNIVCSALKYDYAIFFWNFYSTQQLIGHLPLLGLQMTSNIYWFFSGVSWVMRYAYLPVLPLFKTFMRDSDTGISPTFTDFGYNSTSFVINAQLPILVMLICIPLIMLTYGLHFLSKKVQVLKPISEKMMEIFVLGFFIRVLTQTLLVCLISSLLDLSQNSSNSYFSYLLQQSGFLQSQISNSVGLSNANIHDGSFALSVLFLLVIFLFPLCSCIWLMIKFNTINENSLLRRKFGSFFSQLSLQNRWKFSYWTIFYVLRVVFVFNLVFVNKYPAFQLLLTQSICFLSIYFIAEIQPYNKKWMNAVEFFNQFISLIIFDFLFTFTDFSPTSTGKLLAGWIILALFIIQFLLNLALSAYLMYKFIRQEICSKIIKTQKLKNVIQIKSLKQVDADGIDLFNSSMKLFLNKKSIVKNNDNQNHDEESRNYSEELEAMKSKLKNPNQFEMTPDEDNIEKRFEELPQESPEKLDTILESEQEDQGLTSNREALSDQNIKREKTTVPPLSLNLQPVNIEVEKDIIEKTASQSLMELISTLKNKKKQKVAQNEVDLEKEVDIGFVEPNENEEAKSGPMAKLFELL